MLVGREAALARPDGAWVGMWRNGSGVPIGRNLVVTVRHTGAGAEHVGEMFWAAGRASEVVEIHAHPEAHVDLALLRVRGDVPHVLGIGVDPRQGEPILGGGTGVIGEERTPGEYVWSGERTDSVVGWEHGERRELWARGRADEVSVGSVHVEFSSRSFAGTMSDSGAPILREKSGGYELLGLACGISGEKGRTRFGDKTIYLRLDAYIDWIARHM